MLYIQATGKQQENVSLLYCSAEQPGTNLAPTLTSSKLLLSCREAAVSWQQVLVWPDETVRITHGRGVEGNHPNFQEYYVTIARDMNSAACICIYAELPYCCVKLPSAALLRATAFDTATLWQEWQEMQPAQTSNLASKPTHNALHTQAWSPKPCSHMTPCNHA